MTARRYQHTRAKTPDTTRGEDWRESARCIGSEHIYDLAADHPNDEGIVRAALAICADCPVAEICARELIGLEHGVVGGLTESQRRTIRKRNRSNGITLPTGPADCPTCGLQFANPGRLAAHSRTHEPTCKRGHVIAEVGRTKDRTCRQCRADQQRARNQRRETA